MPPVSYFSILYQDQAILVVDKAAGIAVLPERWEHDKLNLLDIVRRDYPLAVAVHRIDKETSGLLLMSLDPVSARTLQIAFEARRIGKIYHAIVAGVPSWDEMACNAPLFIDGDRLHRSVVCKPGNPQARNCESRFRVIERFRGFCLVEVVLLSGRTHQIRAHAAHLGYPIAGDHLYGGPKEIRLSAIKPKWRGDLYAEKPLLDRVGLHARQLNFGHPSSEVAMEFFAEYPKDIRASLAQLRRLG